MADLTREEFLAHIGYLRDDVAGINERLDTLNGRTRKQESLGAVHSWALGLGGVAAVAIFGWMLSKL